MDSHPARDSRFPGGGGSSVGRALDCGSRCRGFDSHPSPQHTNQALRPSCAVAFLLYGVRSHSPLRRSPRVAPSPCPAWVSEGKSPSRTNGCGIGIGSVTNKVYEVSGLRVKRRFVNPGPSRCPMRRWMYSTRSARKGSTRMCSSTQIRKSR
jgi:hypothetical protein